MPYPKRVLVAIDKLFAAVFLGTMQDETISAWAHRGQHKRTERLINWLFNDPLHCAKAYEAEMQHAQNNPMYRKG